MNDQFFDQPILNSPYEYPARHWELDDDGQPTHRIMESRRSAKFITPVPKPKKRGKSTPQQQELFPTDDEGLSTQTQQYEQTAWIINAVRRDVDNWRREPNHNNWKVTPETARLLNHWRHHPFQGIRPFFCQVEAIETLIWLTEVAPNLGKEAKGFLTHLDNASNDANPELNRLALKLATGTGKTTVMAMLIAWQTINKVRRPNSKKFTRGFLVVSPGLTIRDRLRVLHPNDPNSYYQSRELVPADMLPELERAKIVITNYHAFKLRERIKLAKGSRSLLQGRGQALNTIETEGQMMQRVMPELMGMKNILAINDEAHHCYREKLGDSEEDKKTGEDLKEAKKNLEAARLWISGLEVVNRKIGIKRVIDLSATPFFLSGSGYVEGTLFPWTMSDFSLMDAIESGIVKLPRVPIADNVPGGDTPMFRNLWEHISKDMPKKGRGKGGQLDPSALPTPLISALDALYGHYEKTSVLWGKADIQEPPCFIEVCNNTATSKLVHDYIAGYIKTLEDGAEQTVNGRLALFRNFDDNGNPYPRPNTLLIDSRQLESGEGLDKNFRTMAADEIERFKREMKQRGDYKEAEKITDEMLLREVMNTVGKPGKLGGTIRCVVSVSMLTEGWDASNVTHVLGVRAFGTQLLCEQVIGRALRRQSYEQNDDGLFDVEYADVLGIPFDFTAKPIVAPPQKPTRTIHVHAINPDRTALEIRFPRVAGYRTEPAPERLQAKFTDDATLELTSQLIGATETLNSGIIGEQIDLTLKHTADVRPSQVVFELTTHLLKTKYLDKDGQPQNHLFGQLKRICRQWIDNYLVCKSGTYPAQLKYKMIAEMASEKIAAAITRAEIEKNRPVRAILDPYNPVGSTMHVNFHTSKTRRWQTDPRRCHINWAILDSDWEGELCRVVESHPKVKAYVKNQGLGFEVPYRMGSVTRRYIPDFIVLIDDGHGEDDLLHLIVEIKGYSGEDAKAKRSTMEVYWIPGVNHLGDHGRWAFAELTDVFQMESDFEAKLEAEFNNMIDEVLNEKG